MIPYQVLARKYRPQRFQEVVGQEAIVTTLKNAIKNKRLAHAYLFCGSRGTGKTTLARIFAKGVNCLNLTLESEPCNSCLSCKEITGGHSLDVLEIDGASHRGIDDIRKINETVGYAAASGGYKIYIIDEVHMLTKEAFNALLKTLEEPPARVLFCFATTEPHKVLPTILSRCQRFTLNRIPLPKIVLKLQTICRDLSIEIEEEALRLIANRAEGGLRDAESLLDQLISFHEGPITYASVTAILGIMPKESLFMLDQAGKQGNLSLAFELADQVFSQGKDLIHFVESLIEHFRHLLLIKISGKETASLELLPTEKENYNTSAKLYTKEQCLTILDFLIEAQQQVRLTHFGKISLEALLLKILRIHQRVPVDYLIRRLSEIEQTLATSSSVEAPPSVSSPDLFPSAPSLAFKKVEALDKALTQDPTPSAADLGLKTAIKTSLPAQQVVKPSTSDSSMLPSLPLATVEQPKIEQPLVERRLLTSQEQSRYDTFLQFAAVELEGTIQKNR